MSLIDNLMKEMDEILNELDTDDLKEIPIEKINEVRKDANPYGRTIEGSNNYLTFSYTNLREKYIMNLLMTSMIGYLNRSCDEWHVPNGIPVIPVYDYVQNPDLLTDYHKKWEKTKKNQKMIRENEEWMKKRIIVKEFLEEVFQFNPDEHVRSSYKPQPKDKERQIIDTPAANLAIEKLKKKDLEFREQMLQYDRVLNLKNMTHSIEGTGSEQKYNVDVLNDFNLEKLVPADSHYSIMNFETWTEEDKNLLRNVYTMIPPVDTFHKIRTYMESNYDKLREAVLHLYCHKPELDIAFNPYQWHSSREEAEEFQKKHKNEVISDIYIADSGKWNIVAPLKVVQKTMKYFNENTIVLEEMAKQIEKDKKLGGELMRNRVKKEKRKNIAEEGPDAEAFKKWKEQNKTMESLGAETINQDSYAPDETPDDAIAVPVFRLSKGGLEMEKSVFYSKASAPVLGFEEEEKY